MFGGQAWRGIGKMWTLADGPTKGVRELNTSISYVPSAMKMVFMSNTSN